MTWISGAFAWVETELQAVGVSPEQFGTVALKVASDLLHGATKEAILGDVLSLFRSTQLSQ